MNELNISLEYDADRGWLLFLSSPDEGHDMVLPPLPGVTDEMIRQAENTISAIKVLHDATWDGRDADEVEDAVLAMQTREMMQHATGWLVAMFLPKGQQ